MNAALLSLGLATTTFALACGMVAGGRVPPGTTTSPPDSGTYHPDSGAPVPFSDWVSDLSAVQGAGYARCGLTASYLEAQYQTTNAQAYAPFGAEIQAGLVVYDATAAQECLAALNGSCAALFNGSLQPPYGASSGNASCQKVFTGTVATHGSCFTNEECTSGLCSAVGGSAGGGDAPDGGPLCPGTCAAPYAELGQACDNVTTTCDPSGGTQESGLDCSFGSGGGTTGTCVTSSTGQCPVGSYQGGGSGCEPQVEEGGACGQDQTEPAGVIGWGGEHGFGGQCAGSLACVGYADTSSGGGTPGTCKPASDEGGPCVPVPPGVQAAAAGTGCLSGLLCVSGVCKIPPSSGPCGNDPIYGCDPRSSYCNTTTNICDPLVATGGACKSSGGGGCSATDWCDSTGHCTPKLTCEYPTGAMGSNPPPPAQNCDPLPACPAGATGGDSCDPDASSMLCGTTTCDCSLSCGPSASGDGGSAWQQRCP